MAERLGEMRKVRALRKRAEKRIEIGRKRQKEVEMTI